jgi:hypothetical protein
VVVVDNFPSTEVKALLQMANAAGDAADKAGGSSAVPRSLLQPARSNLPAGTTTPLSLSLFAAQTKYKLAGYI